MRCCFRCMSLSPRLSGSASDRARLGQKAAATARDAVRRTSLISASQRLRVKPPAAFSALPPRSEFIRYGRLRGEKTALKKDSGTGIPSLVLVDSDGNLISSSYANGQYRGPQRVLTDLDNIFAGKPPARVAAAQ